MPEEHNQTVINLLTNLTRDTGQIKTDLAVNTTRTGYIEEHLRVLNGKVAKQEERQQAADKQIAKNMEGIKTLSQSKRRWDDGLIGVLKQLGIFILGVLSTLLSAYLINKYL